MNERAVNLSSFVPFALVAKAADATFRPKLLEQGNEEGMGDGVSGLGSGKTPPQTPDAIPHPPCPSPVITLQREGERVTSVRVECSCGQVIELACSY